MLTRLENKKTSKRSLPLNCLWFIKFSLTSIPNKVYDKKYNPRESKCSEQVRKGQRSLGRAILWISCESFQTTYEKIWVLLLIFLQRGKQPANSKPMTSIGSGVFELKEADERAWYRVIYLAKIEDTVYVLHSFEKQSAKTSRNDLETAEIRLKRVLMRIREAKK